MKGLIKVLVGIIIVFIAIILVVGGALKLYFTQDKIISLVKPQIEKATNRRIEIKGAEFSLLKGFVLKGIAVKEEDGQNDFLSLKEFSISYELWPLLEKKVKVSSISLVDPKINIVRQKNGQFNYESLIPKAGLGGKAPTPQKRPSPAPATGARSALPFAITLNNVSISGAHVFFRDEMGELPGGEATIDLNADLAISPSGFINYDGEMDLTAKTKVGDLPSKIKSHLLFTPSKVSLNGDIFFDEWLVKMKGTISDYMAIPKIAFNLSSKKLDLDAIQLKLSPFLKASGKNSKVKKGVDFPSKTTPVPIPVPPIVQDMEAKGTIEIDELIFSNLPIMGVKVDCLLKNGKLDVKKEIKDLSGGKVASNVHIRLFDKLLPFQGNIALDKVGLSGLMHLLAPKFVGVIVGDIDTEMSFSGNAFSQDAIKKSLVLKGTYGLTNGKIMRNPITIALARLLKMRELEEPSFKSVEGDINLEKGWVLFKSIYSSKEVGVRIERGRVSLDGVLDIPMIIELSKALSEKLVARQKVLQVLLNDNGIAELPITLKGTYSHPVPTLNMKRAKDRLIKGVIKGFLGN